MDIAYLNAFIAVARDESFSKASERLHITQPAVSKRVAALESELGVILFNRVARSISLTEAGKQLLPKARDIVSQTNELRTFASNLNGDISGNLSVSIAHHIGLYRMQPILREFASRYPLVQLDIRFEDSDQAFNSVEQGDIEFGVITLPSIMPEKINSEVVWLDQLHIVVASDHVLAKAKDVTVQDLAKFPCVLTTKETETHQVIDRLFDKHDLVLDTQLENNNLETLKMLVGAGLGWSVLPSTMLNDDKLNVLAINETLTRELGLVFHAKRSLSNAASALKLLITHSKN